MNDPTKRRLLLDPETERWYALPKDLTLPDGELLLREIGGREVHVDAEFVTPFEVTRDEAKQWLKEGIGEVVREGAQGLFDVFRRSRAQSPAPSSAASPVEDAPGSRPEARVPVPPEAVPALEEAARVVEGFWALMDQASVELAAALRAAAVEVQASSSRKDEERPAARRGPEGGDAG